MTKSDMPKAVFKLVDIDRIKNKGRVRKDFGDIEGLARRIDAHGLLMPIGISSDYKLHWGERRLRACKLLGHKRILARIYDSDSPREIERAENEDRKDFTLSERVNAAVGYLEEIGNRRGDRTDRHVADSPRVRPGEKTRDAAAREAGFTSTTLFRDAKKVVERGIPKLIGWMDKEKLAVSTCRVLAGQSLAKQKIIVGEGPKAARKWVSDHRSELKRFATDDMARRPLFPESDAKERAEFEAADPRRSPDKQVKDRFNGVGKIVRAIVDGKYSRDLDWLVRKPESLKAHALIDFADRCRAAAKKLSAVAERLARE
jgi:ParB/Sulfiredoxin domain